MLSGEGFTPFGGRSLTHVHDRAAILQPDLIHQEPYEVDAAPVRGHPVLRSGRVGDGTIVESVSLVPNRDVDCAVYGAAADDLNMLARVLAIAVDDSVGQGFRERDVDVTFATVRGACGPDERHELMDKGRNGCDLAPQRMPYIERRNRTILEARVIRLVYLCPISNPRCMGARNAKTSGVLTVRERIALPHAKNRAPYNVINFQNVALYSESERQWAGPSNDNQICCDSIRHILDHRFDIACFS